MKYKILRNILLAAWMGVASVAMAIAPDLPRVSMNGRDYYYYDVKKGESIYKVAKTLGVTTGDIVKNNPRALDGLRGGMRLYFPVDDAVTAAPAHTAAEPAPVKPVAEAVRASAPTTVPEPTVAAPEPEPVAAIEERPIAKPRADEIPTVQATATEVATYAHKVRRGESLYGIARAANMSMSEVIALNPDAADGVQPGDTLYLIRSVAADDAPMTADTAPAEPAATDDGFEQPDYYSFIERERHLGDSEPIPPYEEEAAPVDTLNVAVLLPFMLGLEELTKPAQLFTEFYEGLLLAADSMNDSPGAAHIMIHAYDTAASTDTVIALMQLPEVREANLIVGPDAEEQLSAIAQRMSPATFLLNSFNVKSQLYKSYPNIIQANIPHGDLYEEAVDAFMQLYDGYRPVFLARVDGSADKDAFVTRLKSRLDGSGIGYDEITFRNLLSHKDLAELTDSTKYVFVPMSGQRSEFAKITEALRRFADERPSEPTVLFGYPEWITFRGDYFNRLGENNATIYTRFYVTADDPARQEAERAFKEAYGVTMLDAAPIQGLLGYDTGRYLIGALRSNHGDFNENPGEYAGIQSSFMFTDRSEADGLVNRALYIVTFGPGGYVNKQLRP